MIYNSLILPHFNYFLLAWGSKCHKIEILQKKAIRVVKFKSPIAYTILRANFEENESTETFRYVYMLPSEIVLQAA